MNIINLTGQTIRIYREDHGHYEVARCFPSHLNGVQAVRSAGQTRWIDGMPIIIHDWSTDIMNELPKMTEDIFYLVPESVARAISNRGVRSCHDLLIPALPLATKNAKKLRSIRHDDAKELPYTTFDQFVIPEVPNGYRVVGYMGVTWLGSAGAFSKLDEMPEPQRIKSRTIACLHDEFRSVQPRCKAIGKELLIGSDYATLLEIATPAENEKLFVDAIRDHLDNAKCFRYTDADLSDLVEYIETHEPD